MTLARTNASAGAQRVTWLLLFAASVGSGALIARAPHVASTPKSEKRSGKRIDLVGVLPAGPELLLTADLEALGPDMARPLLKAGGDAFLGLEQLCGFEPLLGLRSVAMALPPSEPGAPPADFAFVAETSLQPEPVLRCAEAAIRKRGGNPVRSRLGELTSVRDQARPQGEVALRADGLFVLSGGSYFRDVVDAASGARREDEASTLRSRLHAAVRRKLGPSQLALSLLVGPRLPLPGVQALGLGLNVQGELQLRGYVACPSSADCTEASQLLQRLRPDISRESGIPELAQLRIQQSGQQLSIDGRLPVTELAPLLQQLLAP